MVVVDALRVGKLCVGEYENRSDSPNNDFDPPPHVNDDDNDNHNLYFMVLVKIYYWWVEIDV